MICFLPCLGAASSLEVTIANSGASEDTALNILAFRSFRPLSQREDVLLIDKTPASVLGHDTTFVYLIGHKLLR